VEAIFLVANVPTALVEQPKTCKILGHCAENTHGIKHAANALSHMKVEEMPPP